jgi:hypothetical protein
MESLLAPALLSGPSALNVSAGDWTAKSDGDPFRARACFVSHFGLSMGNNGT